MDPFERLIKALGRLPGIGRRSAERMALKLVRDGGGMIRELAAALGEVERQVCCCSKCGNVTARQQDPCRICTDPRRDTHVLCVVEDPGDIVLIEKAGSFQGRYHALMGRLSPMKGEGPENIRVAQLLERIKAEGIAEVVLAMNSDVEGDSTASYLHDLLKDKGVKITRIAFGLPAGSGIAYSDPVTLARALSGRVEMD